MTLKEAICVVNIAINWKQSLTIHETKCQISNTYYKLYAIRFCQYGEADLATFNLVLTAMSSSMRMYTNTSAYAGWYGRPNRIVHRKISRTFAAVQALGRNSKWLGDRSTQCVLWRWAALRGERKLSRWQAFAAESVWSSTEIWIWKRGFKTDCDNATYKVITSKFIHQHF